MATLARRVTDMFSLSPSDPIDDDATSPTVSLKTADGRAMSV